MNSDLAEFLNAKAKQYNNPAFIKDDPISVPHRFSKKQDIEIAGFFAAIFAWGIRTTIINKANELMNRMDDAPYQFITEHREDELKKLLSFKHRTFNATDLLYFIEFLKHHYKINKSLETAFFSAHVVTQKESIVEKALIHFNQYFFSLENAPARTAKHISTPLNKSTCKRLNMFLRWMIRKDNNGVDFGIWKKISPSQLICPVDVHVARVSKKLNLLNRIQVDWQAALELTENLKLLDPFDPVKYDFALFGLGVTEKYY